MGTTTLPTTLKCISLWQPWASLITDGRKQIETRHWPAPAWLIGAELAIHATKYVDRCMCASWGYSADSIPRGAVLGIVRLDKCERFTQDFYKEIMLYQEGRYGDFTPGRFGWFLTLVRKFDKPFPQKGAQGIFNWEVPGGQ